MLAIVAFVGGCPRPDIEPFAGSPQPRDFEERKIWEESQALFEILQKRSVINADTELQSYLNSIVTRLLPFFRLEPNSVAAYTLRDPFLNAFILPNGKLFVSEGLLAQFDSEAQIACVFGHEIAHFAKRDAYAQQIYNQRAVQTVRQVFAVLVAGSGGLVALPGPSLVLELLGGPHTSLLMWQIRGFARDLEYEADRVGQQAVHAAGYDALECVGAMERLLQEEQQLVDEKLVSEPYFYGNHPATVDRLQRFREWQQAQEQAGSSTGQRNELPYRERTAAVVLQTAATNLKLRRFQRARRLIDEYLATFPTRPDGYVALGDWYRRQVEHRNLDAAAEAYKRALAFDAKFAPAHRELGLLCRERGDFRCAREHLREYLDLDPHAMDHAIVQGMLSEIAGGSP